MGTRQRASSESSESSESIAGRARLLFASLAACCALTLPTPAEQVACDLEGDAALFVEALERFRSGDETALPQLTSSARRLEENCRRADPARVAAFYVALSPKERHEGLRVELELDALRAAAAELRPQDRPGTRRLRADLREFLDRNASLADLPVRAHALSLDARLALRLLEGTFQAALKATDRAPADSTTATAAEALRLFRQAGQLTPTLEPLWSLARCALLNSDWAAAEGYFSELASIADRVGRPNWRERGLLGLVGIAREKGSLFAVDGLLDRLASFRDPAESWALAREVAVQQLQKDRPEKALLWLEDYPPNELDPELEGGGRFENALDEWRSLTSAAELRSGRADRAQERLDGGAGAKITSVAVLTQAAIHLDADQPALALERVRLLPLHGARPVDLMDRWTLEGRALLKLGRPSAAIECLERALALARATGPAAASTSAGTREDVASGSRLGEWLGLSAIESLGQAYVEAGDPLRAAALFEWTHAQALSRSECEAEILRLSAASSFGYITWMVGADSTLSVHVGPSGAAEALRVPLRRRGIERGIQRFRDALEQPRFEGAAHPQDSDWRNAGEQLFNALLPPSARRLISAAGPGSHSGSPEHPTLVLSPHSVLERLPFEALTWKSDGPPLGVAVALSVQTALRAPRAVAAPLQGRGADWIALGAPDVRAFEDLPGARSELSSIGRMQPRWSASIGASMTRAALESALQSGRPLHLATHVAPLSRRPGSAASIAPIGFVVAGDEIVSAEEVAALAPKLPLAILTACGSAEGAAVDGLSVRGLAQTMLECGTRAAIVTLWPIEDQAGERAALRMHAALLAGASPAEATRRAREFLWLLGEPPSQWAPYRLLD